MNNKKKHRTKTYYRVGQFKTKKKMLGKHVPEYTFFGSYYYFYLWRQVKKISLCTEIFYFDSSTKTLEKNLDDFESVKQSMMQWANASE